MIHNTSWPYANETGITEKLNCDVLVLGGGLAGCYRRCQTRSVCNLS